METPELSSTKKALLFLVVGLQFFIVKPLTIVFVVSPEFNMKPEDVFSPSIIVNSGPFIDCKMMDLPSKLRLTFPSPT